MVVSLVAFHVKDIMYPVKMPDKNNNMGKSVSWGDTADFPRI
jgi:hypothetical protein